MPSSITSLAALRAKKEIARKEIDATAQRLEYLVGSIPGRMMASTIGMIATAVLNGYAASKKNKEPEPEPAAEAEPPQAQPTFGETLQEVGEETAMYALSRLVEKLLSRT